MKELLSHRSLSHGLCIVVGRLAANDRVDPYVAVYESPTPSKVGDVTHLRWRGLLASTFVQTIIDTAMCAASCPFLIVDDMNSVTGRPCPCRPRRTRVRAATLSLRSCVRRVQTRHCHISRPRPQKYKSSHLASRAVRGVWYLQAIPMADQHVGRGSGQTIWDTEKHSTSDRAREWTVLLKRPR